MARAKKKSSSVKVNFKGVESRKTPPEGDYPLEVLEATLGKSGSGNEQIEFVLEISKGEYKGVKLWFYCPLAENSLWKLHAFLTAMGEDVPEDDMDIDLSDLVGKEVVGVLSHEVYQGKKRAKMTDFDTIDNYEGEDAEDDEDDKPKKGKKAGKSKKDDEDEDDSKSSKKGSKKASKKEEPEEPDYDDMDEDELREAYLEQELGTKKEAKKLDEDELRDALTDAAEAASKKAGKGKKADKGKSSKKAKKLTKDDVEEMDEDELQELIDKHELDVDLDDFKKLSKKIAAVIDALEEEDLLEEDDD